MKKLILIVFSLFIITPLTHAESLDLTMYYPSPAGNYDTLRLVPRNALGLPCLEGLMYTNADDNNILYFCRDVDGDASADWTPMSVWAQNGDDIILNDLTNPELKQVGIGTANPQFSLHLAEDGSIVSEGIHGAGAILNVASFNKETRFLWYPRKSALRAGQDTADLWSDADVGNYTIAFGLDARTDGDFTNVNGGENNRASGKYGNVSGGKDNIASGQYTSISGGSTNTASADYSTISGGESNTASLDHATVSGGFTNIASGEWSTVSGGRYNTAGGQYSTVSGGGGNDASDANTASGIFSTVGGGRHNRAMANWTTVAGGWDNLVDTTAVQSTISGGGDNTVGTGVAASVIAGGNGNTIVGVEPVSRSYITISGGHDNTADYEAATISGGKHNSATANGATISGGISNAVGASDAINKGFSTIGGGELNTATGDWSVIAGGGSNSATASHSSIAGGSSNAAIAVYASVTGGELNNAGASHSSVVGGRNNRTGGIYSFVAGGEDNSSMGEYSWTGGKNMIVSGDRSFAWGYDAVSPVTVAADDVAVFFPDTTAGSSPGNVGIGLTTPTATLHVDGNFKAVLTDFAVDPTTHVLFNTPTSEVGFDIAELFDTNEPVEIGDVLVMDSTSHKKLKPSGVPYDKRVTGVVSGAPAIVFQGRELEIAPSPREFIEGNKPPVALAGRVICKVSLENGPIEVGDLLTTSSTPGHAMKADDPRKAFGAVLGKAFEPFDGGPQGETTGMITIIVNLQ